MKYRGNKERNIRNNRQSNRNVNLNFTTKNSHILNRVHDNS